MERPDFIAAIRQLGAAADILARNGPQEWRLDAFTSLAAFRRYEQPSVGVRPAATSDDELFMRTAQAALTMSGRNEFAAARALIEQAQSLLSAT
jgi:hypothetical protein